MDRINEKTERPDLSASNFGRISTGCAGWLQLLRAVKHTLPKQEESEEATSGSRIHDAISCDFRGVDREPLSEEEEELVERSVNWVRERIYSVINDNFTIHSEERHALRASEGLDSEELVTGTPDLVAVYDGYAVVIDFKTGWLGIDPDGKIAQVQAYLYGAMAIQAYGVERAVVYIYEPRTGHSHRAEVDNLPRVIERIQQLLDAYEQPDARRVPSLEGCKYCPVLAVCDAAHSDLRQNGLAVQVERLPDNPAKLAEALDLASRMEQAAKAIKSHCRLKALDEELIPAGYKVVSRSGTKSITNPHEAYKMIEDKVSREAFNEALSISYRALQDLYGKTKDDKAAFAERVKAYTKTGATVKYLRKGKA